MIHKRLKLLNSTSILILLKAICFMEPAAFANFGVMPKSWFILPEESNDKSIKSFGWTEPDSGFVEDVDDLYEVQGDSYDHMIEEARHSNKRFNSWDLWSIRSQLAVSGQGVIGVLALKGYLAVELRWYRKHENYRYKHMNQAQVDSHANIIFNRRTSLETIEKTLQNVTDLAFKAGRVKNKELMLASLKKEVFSAQKMIQHVPDTSQLAWSPYRFRLKFLFDASGRLVPIDMGGYIQIQFDWEILDDGNDRNGLKTLSHEHHSFHELVNAFSNDMEIFIDREPFGSKWTVNNFQLIVGQTVGGTFGLAKLKGTTAGRLYFRRNKPTFAKNKNKRISKHEKFNFIIEDIDKQTVSYTNIKQLPFQNMEEKDLTRKHAIFHINRRKFRKGLIKAEKIARFFVSRANKTSQKHWDLNEIRTDYRLSIEGTVGIATLENYGEIRVVHAKKTW